ncbi:condensin complex subunit 2/barren [Lipomyces japonicus]|uniref:condensin complex subunit 2/barren n=1 Tax=Lipomyces japonicus TaxID=56871 RepID=UPI0034CDD603
MPRQVSKLQTVLSPATPLRERQSISSSTTITSATSTPTANINPLENLGNTINRRNPLNELNKNVIATTTPRRKASNYALFDDSAHNTPRVPVLSNFEEWMKLATDNKINATNSWNFALIDYFHDMSLLKEGDGINFQKASCTLDGCVKIYTSRIDSVATETGKLLSGLAENNPKKKQAANGNNDDGEHNENDGDEDDESQAKKSKRRVRSEATLAKDFCAIQLKKLDLEFTVDPLFKKASADFDEGGAKGLLLNNLSVDNSGRVVFDTSEDNKVNCLDEVEDEEALPIRELDLDSLRDHYFADIVDDLDNKFISPSLRNFEFPADPNAVPTDIPFLRQDNINIVQDRNLYDPNQEIVYTNDMQDDGDYGDDNDASAEFGNGGDLWLENVRAGSEPPEFNDPGYDNFDQTDGQEDGEVRQIGSYVFQFANKHNETEDTGDNIFAYFDEKIKKNWTGSQHWRIQKVKKGVEDTKKAQKPRLPKKKEEIEINFVDDDGEVNESVLFEHGNPSNILLPKSHWRSKTRNLLPDDINFNSKKLLRPFLKPRVKLRFLTPGERLNGKSGGVIVKAGDDHGVEFLRPKFQNLETATNEDDKEEPVGQTYDAEFFNDDDEQFLAPGFEYEPDFDPPDESFADAQENLEVSPDHLSTLEAVHEVSNDTTVVGNLTAAIRREEAEEELDFGSQLVLNGNRRFKASYVNYAKVAKKVDVKKLKDNLWSSFEYENSELDNRRMSRRKTVGELDLPQAEEGETYFSDIVGGLKNKYPSKALADISTSFCFICLLHLANEKGLEIENNGDYTDLSIKKDLTAVIDEY